MARWTSEHNTFLSCLLDDVTGTEEMVKIRQDYCEIHDRITSCNALSAKVYYTGSKAEGLDLLGSDDDYMFDINETYNIEVSESLQDIVQSTRQNKFLIETDNAPPAFVLLKCERLQSPGLFNSSTEMGNNAYLSSQRYMSSLYPYYTYGTDISRIQGPSIELWGEYADTSISGKDNVPSILYNSWPRSAIEWKSRVRHHGWPFQHDKERIVEFGCHLVPVGHPLSDTKSLEWRLSFSIAERMLVWSFNHTQFQCYAVMKLILKEYVKVHCTENHKGVLCSYFIKTFLFWQIERTDPIFWQSTNLIGCIMYLLQEFYNCIQTGILRHYFIPHFNLLEIKLTQEAQAELMYHFGRILENGLPIIGQCESLSKVHLDFRRTSEINVYQRELLRYRILKNDSALFKIFTMPIFALLNMLRDNAVSYEKLLIAVVRLTSERNAFTSLAIFIIRRLCLFIVRQRLYSSCNRNNKYVYHYISNLDKNSYGTDIASSKLCLAMYYFQQGHYCRSLQIVNDILSSIPPYALYFRTTILTNADSLQLYLDVNCKNNFNILNKAKESWLIDSLITPEEYPYVPRAIQIELDYCDPKLGVLISPFIFAYFLMFLCYHGLNQHDDRDRALHQLIDCLTDYERCGVFKHHSYNIAGHCMLLVGNVETARNMFLESAQDTQIPVCPAFNKYNAAYKYLSLL